MTGIQETPVHALLADGTTVRIRQAGPADRREVQRLYEEMSPQNLRLRFFSVNPSSARQAAERVAGGVRSGYRALTAECDERLVGLAGYEVLPGGSTAEISLAVADDWHDRGVATLLLEQLVDAARTAGITAFSADALAENHDLLKVFHDLGLRVTRHFDCPEVRYGRTYLGLDLLARGRGAGPGRRCCQFAAAPVAPDDRGDRRGPQTWVGRPRDLAEHSERFLHRTAVRLSLSPARRGVPLRDRTERLERQAEPGTVECRAPTPARKREGSGPT